MKIEKLAENKIRIILDLDDLRKNHVDLQSFMANSIESQSLFSHILTQAEKEVGFKTKDCKLLIEALASNSGHFIFIITKYQSDSNIKEDLKKKTVNIKRKTTNLKLEKSIYSFENFEEFCNFCSYIHHSSLQDFKKIIKTNSLYLYKNTYYLVLSDINLKNESLKTFYAFISEFGKLVGHSDSFERKLLEHGKTIMKKDAIKKGIEYFVTKK